MAVAWTKSRVFRLGQLLGSGVRAIEAARDPVIAASAEEVRDAARRYGAAFADGSGVRVCLDIDRVQFAQLVGEAQRRRTHSEKLASLIIGRVLADPILLANASGD